LRNSSKDAVVMCINKIL